MRNRVTPLGDIVAIPLRGAWTGNRGILHRGSEIVRFHAGSLWITCALSYRDWRLPQWQPHHFTVLFFHDEAVALAAGHRPCALCRRPAYEAFRAPLGRPGAADLDRALHGERLFRGTHRRRLHPMAWRDVPAGAFVLLDDGPALAEHDTHVPWTTEGYGRPVPRPRSGRTNAITPPTSMAALRGGYVPQVSCRQRR
jgi:hypothetical protein